MNRASKRQFATLCLFEHINLTVTNLDNDFQFFYFNWKHKDTKKTNYYPLFKGSKFFQKDNIPEEECLPFPFGL